MEAVASEGLVLHTLPAILVLDKVVKHAEPSRLQARFFGYNMDGYGRLEAVAKGFRVMRPHAVLHGFAASQGPVAFDVAHLPIPEEKARLHPYAVVETREARLDPLLITLLIPAKGMGETVTAQIQPAADTFEIRLRHGNRHARCRKAM